MADSSDSTYKRVHPVQSWQVLGKSNTRKASVRLYEENTICELYDDDDDDDRWILSLMKMSNHFIGKQTKGLKKRTILYDYSPYLRYVVHAYTKIGKLAGLNHIGTSGLV